MLYENLKAWNIWQMCHIFSRQKDFFTGLEGRISIKDVIILCELKDATEEDFDKILLIEQKIYPVHIDKLIQQKELSKNG